MIRWAIAVAALGIGMAPLAANAYVLCDEPGKLEELQQGLWKLNPAFVEKRFDELDRHFNAILARVESGKMSDAEAERSFRVFDAYGLAREPLHLEWIAKHPDSQAAYLAAAYHYVARGFSQRGADFASATSEMQFRAMADAFRKALFLLEKADALSKKPTISAALRIHVVTASGMPKGTDATTLYRKALKSYPDTLQVRIRYIWASQPKWGGSMKQLAAIADEAKGLNSADQRYIQYLVHEELGSAFEHADDTAKAVEAYERAVPLCIGLTGALDALIRVHRVKKNYDGVISATTRYLERRPRAGGAYGTRAWAHLQKKNYQESFNDYQRSVELGHNEAYYGLAWHYEWGFVVPKDYRRAIDLYMTAADRGVEGARARALKVGKEAGIPVR